MKKIITVVAALMALFLAVYVFNSDSGNNSSPGRVAAEMDETQNSMEADFNFNYQVFEARGKNITIFSSPDNYLIEFNRPRIPLYSKEIELAENASLVNVELKDFEMKTYENVEVEFTPFNEHFVPTNDSLKGSYPEQVLQYNVFETLDGRNKVELIAAPMQYNNETKQAKIYSSMKIVVYVRP